MRLRQTTPVATDAAPESVRLFDRGGRFVARVAPGDLERTVSERGLAEGWVLADGDDMWRPVAVAVADAGKAPVRRSGIYARGEIDAARKAG